MITISKDLLNSIFVESKIKKALFKHPVIPVLRQLIASTPGNFIDCNKILLCFIRSPLTPTLPGVSYKNSYIESNYNRHNQSVTLRINPDSYVLSPSASTSALFVLCRVLEEMQIQAHPSPSTPSARQRIALNLACFFSCNELLLSKFMSVADNDAFWEQYIMDSFELLRFMEWEGGNQIKRLTNAWMWVLNKKNLGESVKQGEVSRDYNLNDIITMMNDAIKFLPSSSELIYLFDVFHADLLGPIELLKDQAAKRSLENMHRRYLFAHIDSLISDRPQISKRIKQHPAPTLALEVIQFYNQLVNDEENNRKNARTILFQENLAELKAIQPQLTELKESGVFSIDAFFSVVRFTLIDSFREELLQYYMDLKQQIVALNAEFAHAMIKRQNIDSIRHLINTLGSEAAKSEIGTYVSAVTTKIQAEIPNNAEVVVMPAKAEAQSEVESIAPPLFSPVQRFVISKERLIHIIVQSNSIPITTNSEPSVCAELRQLIASSEEDHIDGDKILWCFIRNPFSIEISMRMFSYLYPLSSGPHVCWGGPQCCEKCGDAWGFRMDLTGRPEASAFFVLRSVLEEMHLQFSSYAKKDYLNDLRRDKKAVFLACLFSRQNTFLSSLLSGEMEDFPLSHGMANSFILIDGVSRWGDHSIEGSEKLDQQLDLLANSWNQLSEPKERELFILRASLGDYSYFCEPRQYFSKLRSSSAFDLNEIITAIRSAIKVRVPSGTLFQLLETRPKNLLEQIKDLERSAVIALLQEQEFQFKWCDRLKQDVSQVERKINEHPNPSLLLENIWFYNQFAIDEKDRTIILDFDRDSLSLLQAIQPKLIQLRQSGVFSKDVLLAMARCTLQDSFREKLLVASLTEEGWAGVMVMQQMVNLIRYSINGLVTDNEKLKIDTYLGEIIPAEKEATREALDPVSDEQPLEAPAQVPDEQPIIAFNEQRFFSASPQLLPKQPRVHQNVQFLLPNSTIN